MATKANAFEVPYNLKSGYEFHKQDWALEDIKRIVVDLCDGNDEPRFCWILQLKNGEWLAVRGAHDYTGWDCISHLYTEKYKTKREAMRTLVDWEREELEKEKENDKV